MAAAIARIPDPARQASIAADLFGKSGQKLVPLLQQGSKGFDGLAQAAKDAGIVLTDGQIAKADETADKIDKLNQAMQVKWSSVVADNADAVGYLAEKFIALVGAAADATRAVGKFFEKAEIRRKLILDDKSPLRGQALENVVNEMYRQQQAGYVAGGKAMALTPFEWPTLPEIVVYADPPGKGGAGRAAPSRPSTDAMLKRAGRFADYFDGRIAEIEKQAEAFESLRRQLDPLYASQQKFKEQTQQLDAALKSGTITTEQYWNLWRAARDERVLPRIAEQFDETLARAQRFGDLTAEAFGQWIYNGGNLVDIYKRLALQMLVIEPLLDRIRKSTTSLFSGGGGGLGSLFGLDKFFGGFFADGGTLAAGKWGIVGEDGPELIGAASTARTVIPNGVLRAMGGGGGYTFAPTINAPGATAETVAMIRRELAAFAPAIAAGGAELAMRNAQRRRLPGRA